MSNVIRFRRRAVGGAAGAPGALKTAEPAYNMQDGVIYIGFGDDGSGNATTIKAFGRDNFVANVPAGGTTGQVLAKSSNADGAWVWQTVAEGAFYTASGNGIELTGSEFSLNYAEIDTGLTLTTRLAGKADVAHTHAAGDITSGTFNVARIPDLDTAKITTGVFAIARIPDLDAAKVTTGTFADARIPNLNASKVNAGTFDAARIPGLDASKITSGVIDVARIPVLPSNKTVVSSGGIAALTAPQQADIAEGTVVTVTDGRRFVYSGTGSKTVEASYIELADITPDWANVSGKPTFAAVATSGSYLDLTNRPTLAAVATSGAYNDLTGRPTLGTMASQNANGVAITGGTITGITLDGGTF